MPPAWLVCAAPQIERREKAKADARAEVERAKLLQEAKSK